jgi:hypothetical protein
MLRFAARYGLVRMAGRRVLPVLMVWDAMVMANKVRQIPVVDRGLRRGAGAARRRVAGAVAGRTRPGTRRQPWTQGAGDGRSAPRGAGDEQTP